MKAIETTYAGCRFRSRLEARWAVFFDQLGIRWDYEPQGFEIATATSHRCYLPDFYLPEIDTWVEVKGSDEQITDDYSDMLAHAIDWGGPLADGLLLLGPIPDTRGASFVAHHQLVNQKGVAVRCVRFDQQWLKERQGIGWNISRIDFPFLLDGEGECTDAYSGDGIPSAASFEAQIIQINHLSANGTWNVPAALRDAYIAARSARFEHGEKGAPAR